MHVITKLVSTQPVIGIVPAAGRATRLPHRTCSKELLPVGTVDDHGVERPRAISEYLVDAMVSAGAERLCMIVAPDKHDLVSFYGSGARHRTSIAYLCQESPTGMSDAIDLAYAWLKGSTVLMGMPDTLVEPADSLRMIRALVEQSGCDVALAVAPTAEPCRLGPVDVDAGGRVTRVMDKPERAPHNHVWTVACWGPSFTDFLHASLRGRRAMPEAPLGLIFQDALERGFDLRAIEFADGSYIDAGTPDGLATARQRARRLPMRA